MKNTMKRTQRTEEKKSGSRALVFALLVAMMIALFPQKNQAFAAEREAIGTGTLNANWVNLGLNWYMTGGTSGRVVRGESFIVYEKKTVNQTNRYYVYAENAGIYGYISERFLSRCESHFGYGNAKLLDFLGLKRNSSYVQEKAKSQYSWWRIFVIGTRYGTFTSNLMI